MKNGFQRILFEGAPFPAQQKEPGAGARAHISVRRCRKAHGTVRGFVVEVAECHLSLDNLSLDKKLLLSIYQECLP